MRPAACWKPVFFSFFAIGSAGGAGPYKRSQDGKRAGPWLSRALGRVHPERCAPDVLNRACRPSRRGLSPMLKHLLAAATLAVAFASLAPAATACSVCQIVTVCAVETCDPTTSTCIHY